MIGIGSPQGAAEWNIDRIGYVQDAVLRNSGEDDTILALWPGYMVGLPRRGLPGSENHFGYRIGDKLTAEQRARYQIKSIDDLVLVIDAQAVSLVVGYRRHFRGKIRQALKRQEYKEIEIDGLVEIWIGH